MHNERFENLTRNENQINFPKNEPATNLRNVPLMSRIGQITRKISYGIE